MPNLLRKSDGRPLRDAIQAAGLSCPKLAAATKQLDPNGRGISPALVGRLTGRGTSARDHCRPRTAQLIAQALGRGVEELFTLPEASTDTVERSNPDGNDDDTSA